MSISVEIQLILLIAALYLYDSVLLLFSNEAVVHRVGGGTQVFFPHENATFGRRLTLLLPLMLPFFLAFKFSWDTSPGRDRTSSTENFIKQCSVNCILLAALAPFTVFIGIGVFLAVPVGLHFLPTIGFLALVVFIYFGIVYLLIRLWLIRDSCGLTKEKFFALAFESLACPPCAVNLLRKVSLHLPQALDLVDFVEQALPLNEQQDVVLRIIKRVDDKLLAEEPDSLRAERLRSYVTELRTRFQIEQVEDGCATCEEALVASQNNCGDSLGHDQVAPALPNSQSDDRGNT